MASNIFSDWLAPVASYLNDIPVVGKVLQFADKLAANTDLSHLGTAFSGKLYNKTFNTDAADIWTSEEARTGAAHSVGSIYGLGELFAGGEAAAPTVVEGAGAAEIGAGTSAGMGGAGEATSGYTAGMGGAGEVGGGGQVVKSASLASKLSDGIKLSNQVKSMVSKPSINSVTSNMNGRTISGDTENINTPSSSPTDLNYARSKQASDHYKKIAKMLKMAQEISPELYTPELRKGLADAFKLDLKYTAKNPYNQQNGGL